MKKDVILRELRGPWHLPRRRWRPPAVLVRRRPLVRHQVLVSCGGRTLIAAMGAGGLRALKREGDRATPIARVVPVACLRRSARPAGLPWRVLRADDGWCDDTASGRYNTAVRLPFAHGHERLSRLDSIYDDILITDHNQRPRIRGAGSAIFFHIARDGMTATLGCLAFSAADWRRGIVPMGPYLIGVDPRARKTR